MRIDELLWVEDQKEFVASLMPVLKPVCGRIRHVTTIAEACSAFDSTPFDLVLLDLQLQPGTWGGLNFLRELGPRASTVPIIVVSGAGTLAECIEAMRLGAKDYVPKENARTDLISIIEKVMESFRAQQPLDDYASITRTERMLKELVMSLLATAAEREGKDIFRSFVPPKVAMKSYERWLQNSDGQQADFLDLLDFAAIIDYRWNLDPSFQLLGKVLNPKNREERTKWLVALNEARKLVAHPIRGGVGSRERELIIRSEQVLCRWRELLEESLI